MMQKAPAFKIPISFNNNSPYKAFTPIDKRAYDPRPQTPTRDGGTPSTDLSGRSSPSCVEDCHTPRLPAEETQPPTTLIVVKTKYRFFTGLRTWLFHSKKQPKIYPDKPQTIINPQRYREHFLRYINQAPEHLIALSANQKDLFTQFMNCEKNGLSLSHYLLNIFYDFIGHISAKTPQQPHDYYRCINAHIIDQCVVLVVLAVFYRGDRPQLRYKHLQEIKDFFSDYHHTLITQDLESLNVLYRIQESHILCIQNGNKKQLLPQLEASANFDLQSDFDFKAQ